MAAAVGEADFTTLQSFVMLLVLYFGLNLDAVVDYKSLL